MNAARQGKPGANGEKLATYSGRLTQGARKRLARAVTLLCQAVKPKWVRNPLTGQYHYHKLSFVTLTVPTVKMLSAKQAYKLLLAPFLDWLRKTKGVTTYIWKAELTERGQIHYHLTTPDFIPWDEIRRVWNRQLHDAGLLDEYAKQHGHFNPNSTDIHETRQVKNMSNYLIKELGKNINARRNKARKMVDSLIQAGELPADQRQQFIDEYTGDEVRTDGKLWDCSNNLAGAKYFAVPLKEDTEKILRQYKKSGNVRVIGGDWWEVIYFEDGSPPGLLSPDERRQFDEYLNAIVYYKLTDETADQTESLAEIDSQVLDAEIDTMQSFSWEQLSLFLN